MTTFDDQKIISRETYPYLLLAFIEQKDHAGYYLLWDTNRPYQVIEYIENYLSFSNGAIEMQDCLWFTIKDMHNPEKVQMPLIGLESQQIDAFRNYLAMYVATDKIYDLFCGYWFKLPDPEIHIHEWIKAFHRYRKNERSQLADRFKPDADLFEGRIL